MSKNLNLFDDGLKEVTALILIHFDSYGELGMSKELDDIRWSKLKEFLFEKDKETMQDMIIVSSNLGDSIKLQQLKEEVAPGSRHNRLHEYDWIELPKRNRNTTQINSIDLIKALAGKLNYKITNVLMAGQNISGCVWNSLDYSALRWLHRHIPVTIILSMCGDYETSGTGPLKYINSFARLYQKIQVSGNTNIIQLVSDLKHIDLRKKL